ncbi:MAG: hypothetical protein K2P14_08170, partial [Anaeroplasmataceae bacterium]|nr:hypothetical protein [Anaeroplasmataceae bacterium]
MEYSHIVEIYILKNINGMNLFSYCKNNPIMYVDENGNFAISLALLGVVGGGIVGGALGAGAGYSVSTLTGIKGLSFIGGHVFLIKDTIALGHFGYVAIAGEFGFGFYQISPAEYEAMTIAQRWAMNSKFLDDCAKLGANFAVFPNRTIGPDSTLYAEINYLLELGYQWTTDLSELIRRLF